MRCCVVLSRSLTHTLSLGPASQIRWTDRFKPGPYGARVRTCYVTLDGTDFRIAEPMPFSKKWYSHKFKRAGVRYEIAICIQTGEIVFVNGPFACGRWPDVKIFKSKLLGLLAPGEMVEADNGYPNLACRVPKQRISLQDSRARALARARHECINKKFKQWGCLDQPFRHALWKHKCCAQAIFGITQLAIRRGEIAFDVNY